MTERFIRKVVVEIAGLRISDVKIRFVVDLPNPAAEIWIYNLSLDTHNLIQSQGSEISIAAGYRNTVGLLMEGTLQEIRRLPERGEYTTHIVASGFLNAPDVAGSVTNRSYEGDTSVREIAADLISDMGLLPGPMSAIPEDAVVEDQFVWVLSPSSGLNMILNTLDVDTTWYEDDGVIRFRQYGEPQPDGQTILLSPATGLIGSPSRREADKATARAMLDAQWRVGNVVQMESVGLQGTYTVASVSHTGDNWDGNFMSDLELILVPGEAPQAEEDAFSPEKLPYGILGPGSIQPS